MPDQQSGGVQEQTVERRIGVEFLIFAGHSEAAFEVKASRGHRQDPTARARELAALGSIVPGETLLENSLECSHIPVRDKLEQRLPGPERRLRTTQSREQGGTLEQVEELLLDDLGRHVERERGDRDYADGLHHADLATSSARGSHMQDAALGTLVGPIL